MDHLNTGELDVVVLSLSGPATIAFVTDERNHALFRKRPIFVSLGRPGYDDVAAHNALDRYLAEHDIALLFGFGLEPGLVEILMNDLASTCDAGTLHSLNAICGGVPQHPSSPLNYDLLFGDRLPAHNRAALIKINGKQGYCQRFDMKEARFIDGVGLLDVYHDGLSPYLLGSPRFQAIPSIRQQTARWPGFFDCVRNLIALGLLDEHALPGDTSTPSDLIHGILTRNGKLARNRPDISFVEVSAEHSSGERSMVRVLAKYDENTNLTGMAQLTSFLAAWTASKAIDLPSSCRAGVTLSHAFYDHDMTRELVTAYREHVRCNVITSSRTPGAATA